MRSFVLGAVLVVSVAVPIVAQDAAGPATIRSLVEAGRDDDLRWPDFSDYRKHLRNFYEPLNYGFAWSRNGKVTPQAFAVIALFALAAGYPYPA